MDAREQRPQLGYVLKGYPRLSELFIASEILRLEEAGLPLRIFVIKPPDETLRHSVVERIRSEVVYLPDAGSVSGVSLLRWLRERVPAFRPAIRHALVRHPTGVVRAAAAALAQAVRARRSWLAAPRKVYLKELFQAFALVHAVDRAAGVRHLHAHFCHGATTVTWLASLMTGTSFSFTAHAKDLYESSHNPSGLLERKLAAASFAVTCTEASRKHILAESPAAHVECVYHGLNADLEGLLCASPPEPRPREEFVVLGVGRLVRKKGFDLLVRACGELRHQRARVSLRLVGPSGDAESELRKLVEALGLDRVVEFVGARDQAGLLQEFARASAFALPCRILPTGDRDGIPNVLVEAMACEVPVVTTRVSGIPELVTDGFSGLLVDGESPGALAAALGRLYDQPELATRLVSAARETVAERFDGRVLANRLVGLFESVLK